MEFLLAVQRQVDFLVQVEPLLIGSLCSWGQAVWRLHGLICCSMHIGRRLEPFQPSKSKIPNIAGQIRLRCDYEKIMGNLVSAVSMKLGFGTPHDYGRNFFTGKFGQDFCQCIAVFAHVRFLPLSSPSICTNHVNKVTRSLSAVPEVLKPLRVWVQSFHIGAIGFHSSIESLTHARVSLASCKA